MTDIEFLQIVGPETANKVVAGLYGDASLHAHGFVVADPCYILSKEGNPSQYQLFLAAKYAHFPERNPREWSEMRFLDRVIYTRDTNGDGFRHGHCVDSGQLVAVPVDLCSPPVRECFPLAPQSLQP